MVADEGLLLLGLLVMVSLPASVGTDLSLSGCASALSFRFSVALALEDDASNPFVKGFNSSGHGFFNFFLFWSEVLPQHRT